MQIIPQTILSRSGESLLTPLGGGQAIVLNVAEGRFFRLNLVGRQVWERLETPTTFSELCRRLGRGFRVDPEACQADVGKFVRHMVNNGLIRAG